MTLLQVGINLVLAIVAFALTTWLLAQAGADGFLATLVAVIVAVGVFLANFAARLRA